MSVKFRNSDGTTQLGYIDLVNINMTVMNQQNGNIIFGTNNGEDMRILTNGNVGIGTQTPEFRLDVNGNVRLNAINLQSVTNQTITQLGYSNKIPLLTGTITQSNTVTNPKSMVDPFTLPIGVYIISYNIFGLNTGQGLIVTGNLAYNNLTINHTASYQIAGANMSIGASCVLPVTSASQNITLQAWGVGQGILTPSTGGQSSYVQYTRIA